MKASFSVLLFLLVFVQGAFAQDAKKAIDEKYSAIVDAEKINAADIQWLEKMAKAGGIDECISVALLFRSDSEKYAGAFAEYFHLEKVAKPVNLSREEVNQKVNQLMELYREREPIEVASRIYLSFRGSNKVFSQGESQLYLEMMFRASVFTGIIKPGKEDLMKLSAFVDSPVKDSKK